VKILKIGLIFTLLSFSSPLFAQSFDTIIKRANQEYNAGEYTQSIKNYRKAIQKDPEKKMAYRNVARAYFWLEDYRTALAYYDFYLGVPGAIKDEEQIRKERRLAAERAGSARYRSPKTQRKILTALEKTLNKGSALRANGGGAFRMYENLLRAGFAEPRLIDIRKRLASALMNEFDASILPKSDTILPIISIEGLGIQQKRLEALVELSHDEAMLGLVKRRRKILLAMDAILDGDEKRAISSSAEAARQNPDLLFLSWFVISSLLKSGDTESALKEISQLARRLKQESPELLEYVRVLRALAIQQKGGHKDAAEMFSTILRSN